MIGGALDALREGRGTPGELRDAVRLLHEQLNAIAGLDSDTTRRAPDEDGSAVTGGHAIGPKDAGRCALDSMRTLRFVRGLEAALLEARRRFSERPIELLYAGCGPFATLALPMLRRFGPEELRVTLLDVHERSLASAARVLDALGLRGSLRELVHGDAAAYVPTGRGPHVVVVEAMQRALEREAQLAITAQLAPRLRAGALWVPECIAIDAFLCDPGAELAATTDAPVRHQLGRVLDLRAETAPALWAARQPAPDGHALTPLLLHVPEDAGGLHLTLGTTIDVYGPHRLGEADSGITLPLHMHALGRLPARAHVELRYVLDERPGFRARLVEEREENA